MKNPTLLVVLVAAIVVMLLPVVQPAKYTLIVLIIAVVLYAKRGYLFVAMGSRKLNGKQSDPEKAWEYYERGWKAGLSPKYTVMLGNLFVQRGDAEVALRIFDSVVDTGRSGRHADPETAASARISRSMALWVLDRRDEAIESLQQIRSDGRMDRNLAINLGSYLLETNRLDEARSLIEEAAENLPETPGMADNRGWLFLLTGAFAEAQRLYDTLLSEGTPRFPEAYVHAAQAKMALGKNREAVELLKKALERPFYKTSVVRKEDVEQLLGEASDLPDTAVTGEDGEKELEISLYEEDLFDDDTPNTDVDDDDDGEPNIELDEEDYADEEDPEVEIDPDDDRDLESELFDEEYEDEEDSRN